MAYEDIRWASLGGLSQEPPQRIKDFGYTTSTGTGEGTSEAPILQWTNWQFNKIYDAIENLASGNVPDDGGGTVVTERAGVNVILNGDFSEGTAYWSFSGTSAELIVEDEPLALSGKVGVWTPTGASTMTSDPVVVPLPIQNILGAVDFQYKTTSEDFSVLVYQGATVLGNYPIPSSVEYANLFDEVPLPAAGEQVFVRLETTSAGSITLSGIQLGATGLEAVLDGTTMSPSLAGEVVDYAGNTVPSGWLECDGSVLEKTTYPDLFNAIGDTYATTNYFTDDGSLNTYPTPPSGSFRLPDYRNAYLCDSSVSGLGDALEDTTAVNGLADSGDKKITAEYANPATYSIPLRVLRTSNTKASAGSLAIKNTALQTDVVGQYSADQASFTRQTVTLTGDAVTRPKSFIVKKIIRCWNSTASGMGAPIATETEYGLVKLEPPTPPVENRVQSKMCTRSLDSTGTTAPELDFNNLVVGKWYRLTYTGLFQHGSTASTVVTNISINWYDGSVDSGVRKAGGAQMIAGYQNVFTLSNVFKATNSSLRCGYVCDAVSFCVIYAGSPNYPWGSAILEELNDYKETTDFT